MIVVAIVLLLNAVFNALVWPRFYPRIANDPRARDVNGKATVFLKVHTVLISVALLLAVVSVVVAVGVLTGVL